MLVRPSLILDLQITINTIVCLLEYLLMTKNISSNIIDINLDLTIVSEKSHAIVPRSSRQSVTMGLTPRVLSVITYIKYK